MIKAVNYADIDFQKFESCLARSTQNSDFASTGFLNIVAENHWELLIYKDYEAVMPIAFSKKFGVKFIVMPKFCMQLGVFSEMDSPELNYEFYRFLNANYLVVYYAFNSENHFNLTLAQKMSYRILKNNYEEIYRKYSKSRKRNLKSATKFLDKIDLKENFNSKTRHFVKLNLKGNKNSKVSEHYYNLSERLVKEGFGKIKMLVFENEIRSFSFLYFSKNTVYLSLFVNVNAKKNDHFPSVLIDSIVKETIASNNFDFVGSNLDTIAAFNERFGAEIYKYPVVQNSKFILFKKMLNGFKIISSFATSYLV